ncbi:hypothetical protein [Micromonospora sp. NPDC049891]|uniref:hypothetical protein n=1 Tax=Micromonospora sp. NPDC049891 TaxID=3155655 RepID=UPI0033E5279A
MTAAVTMPADVAMFLTAGHLNHLHAAGQDLGCCPVCCGPCLALKKLLDAGQLDDIVREYASWGGGWECWDEQAGQVDRVWLAGAWRMTDCHDTEAIR